MADLELGPLAAPEDPVAVRAIAERHELLRIASVRALKLHAQIGHLDAQSLAAAQHYAAQEPLQGPMSQGIVRGQPVIAVRACMGGNCASRESCALYWAGTGQTPRGHIAERACPPGLDQPVAIRAVQA